MWVIRDLVKLLATVVLKTFTSHEEWILKTCYAYFMQTSITTEIMTPIEVYVGKLTEQRFSGLCGTQHLLFSTSLVFHPGETGLPFAPCFSFPTVLILRCDMWHYSVWQHSYVTLGEHVHPQVTQTHVGRKECNKPENRTENNRLKHHYHTHLTQDRQKSTANDKKKVILKAEYGQNWRSAKKDMDTVAQHPRATLFTFSKFSAPTIAFLAFWLAKKLRLWANIPSFTSYGK